MVEFEGGPADGRELLLKRAPVMLRCVFNTFGGFNGLDELGDVAAKHETVWVYRRIGEAKEKKMTFDKKSNNGTYQVAKYKLMKAQPKDHEVRDTEGWRKWATKNKGAE